MVDSCCTHQTLATALATLALASKHEQHEHHPRHPLLCNLRLGTCTNASDRSALVNSWFWESGMPLLMICRRPLASSCRFPIRVCNMKHFGKLLRCHSHQWGPIHATPPMGVRPHSAHSVIIDTHAPLNNSSSTTTHPRPFATCSSHSDPQHAFSNTPRTEKWQTNVFGSFNASLDQGIHSLIGLDTGRLHAGQR